MKFDIEKSTLESILSTLQPFLEKKNDANITSHILFQIERDRLIFRATDLEIGLFISTKEFVKHKEGSFTCHGKKVLDIIRALKDATITRKKTTTA
ncbi:MAG: hypothetical protein LBP40_00230 [Campylobacteraceae bacterium]|nr:hypothetical protein [Campylobacteraceae bacterium]